MTDRELMQMALDALEKLNKGSWILADFEDEIYGAIEALRAALAQPEPTNAPQEPVAWADRYDLDREGHDFWVSRQASVRTGVPLYTAPPQREWQGLTDEEIEEAHRAVYGSEASMSDCRFADELEAKLKEKNT